MTAFNAGSVQVTFGANIGSAVAGFKSVSNQFNQTVTSVQSGVARIANSFSSLQVLTGSLFSVGFTTQIAEFDKYVVAIRGVSKVTEEEFKATRATVVKLAQELRVPATDVARSLNDIVQAGFNTADALKLVEASIKGAKAGLTDTATASNALIQVLNAFTIPASQSEEIMGKLIKAVDIGVFSFAQLVHNIGTVAPIARVAGVSLEETLGLLTSLTRQESNLDEVSTQVRAVLSDLLAPSVRARAAIEGILQTTIEASIRTRGFTVTMQELIRATHGSASALADLFPNIRALNAISKLASNGVQELNKDIKILTSSGVATLSRTLEIQRTSLSSLLGEIKSSFGLAFIKTFENNRNAIISNVQAFQKFIEKNGELLVKIAGTTVAIAAVATVFGALKLALNGIGILLSYAVAGFGALGKTVSFLAGSSGLAALGSSIKSIVTGFNALLPVTNFNKIAAQGLAAATAQVTTATNAQAIAVANLATAQRASALAQAQLTRARQTEASAAQKVTDIQNIIAGPQPRVGGRFVAKAAGPADLVAAQGALASATQNTAAKMAGATIASQAYTVAQVELTTASNAVTQAQYLEAAAMNVQTNGVGRFALSIKNLIPTLASWGETLKNGVVVGLTAARTAVVALATSPLATLGGLFSRAAGGIAAFYVALNASTGAMLAALAPYALFAAALAAIAATAYVAFRAGQKLRELFSNGFYGADTKKEIAESEALDDLNKKYIELDATKRRSRQADAIDKGKSQAEAYAAKLRELNEAAKLAAGGNYEATLAVQTLSKELANIQKSGGTGIDVLRAEFERLNKELDKGVVRSRELGKAPSVNKKDGKFINNEDALAKGFVDSGASVEESQRLAVAYREMDKLLQNLATAELSAAENAHKLTTAQGKLGLAVAVSQKLVADQTKDIEKLSKERFDAGKTPEQKSLDGLDEELQTLESYYQNLETQRKEIIKNAAKAGSTVASDAAIKAIDEQKAKVMAIAKENSRQFEKIEAESAKKKVDLNREALDQTQQMEVEALRNNEKFREAEELAAQLRHDKALERLDKEKELTDDTKKAYKQAVEDAYNSELAVIQRNERERYLASEAGRAETKKADEEKKKALLEQEAAVLRIALLEAESNGNVKEALTLREKLLEKLKEAGNEQQRQLELDRQSVLNAKERIALLRKEVDDRLRAGQGAAGVVAAATSAQQSLVGSSSVDTFRGASQDKLSKFGNQDQAKQFAGAVTETLKLEYNALERQRRQAIRDGDKKLADEIAAKQKEVAEKYRILLEELKTALTQIKKQKDEAVKNAPKPSKAPLPTSPLYGAPDPNLETSPLYGGDNLPSQPQTPQANPVTVSTENLQNSASQLADALSSNQSAFMNAFTTVATKLQVMTNVLNQNTLTLNNQEAELQKLRIEGRD